MGDDATSAAIFTCHVVQQAQPLVNQSPHCFVDSRHGDTLILAHHECAKHCVFFPLLYEPVGFFVHIILIVLQISSTLLMDDELSKKNSMPTDPLPVAGVRVGQGSKITTPSPSPNQTLVFDPRLSLTRGIP